MIKIEQLHKKFGALVALKDINLQLQSGECIALIGPNGCGKTTLIKSILGMVIPDSGKIIVQGEDIRHHERYRERIGYMPQIGRYPDNMRIGQIIEIIKEVRQSREATDETLFNQLILPDMLQKRMRTLSGGTTQKVSAGLAFLFNPDILILDEPTAGLDPLASEILKEKIIEAKQKGKLILITSHLLSELDDLISHVIFMQEGEIKFHRSIAELAEITGEDKISKSIAYILKNNKT